MRERLIRIFGGWDRIPQYLKRGLQARDRARQRREDAERARREAEDREFKRLRSLRRPPENVRLTQEGSLKATKVHWDPPTTADQLRPNGYWVSEFDKGRWINHGDYVQPHIRSANLYGQGPARVESVYTNLTKLGESIWAQSEEEIHGDGPQTEQEPEPVQVSQEKLEAQPVKPFPKAESVASTEEPVELRLEAELHPNGSGNTGAFGQHRLKPPAGRFWPSTFVFGGRAYSVRGWYTDQIGRLHINMAHNGMEIAFKEAALTVNLGNGLVVNSKNMSTHTGELLIATGQEYLPNETYTIRISK